MQYSRLNFEHLSSLPGTASYQP